MTMCCSLNVLKEAFQSLLVVSLNLKSYKEMFRLTLLMKHTIIYRFEITYQIIVMIIIDTCYCKIPVRLLFKYRFNIVVDRSRMFSV